jgi:hypothetical protein
MVHKKTPTELDYIKALEKHYKHELKLFINGKKDDHIKALKKYYKKHPKDLEKDLKKLRLK